MNWGVKITIAFILFITFILSCVYIAVNSKMDLVTENYYEAELAYEDVITGKRNVTNLKNAVNIKKEDGFITIGFTSKIDSGTVLFYKPNDVDKDHTYPITVDDQNVMRISVQELQKGLYKIKLSWSNEGKPYYMEHQVFL